MSRIGHPVTPCLSCRGGAVGTVDIEGACLVHCPGNAQTDEQDEKPESGTAKVASECKKWRGEPHEQQLTDQRAYMDFSLGRGSRLLLVVLGEGIFAGRFVYRCRPMMKSIGDADRDSGERDGCIGKSDCRDLIAHTS